MKSSHSEMEHAVEAGIRAKMQEPGSSTIQCVGSGSELTLYRHKECSYNAVVSWVSRALNETVVRQAWDVYPSRPHVAHRPPAKSSSRGSAQSSRRNRRRLSANCKGEAEAEAASSSAGG